MTTLFRLSWWWMQCRGLAFLGLLMAGHGWPSPVATNWSLMVALLAIAWRGAVDASPDTGLFGERLPWVRT